MSNNLVKSFFKRSGLSIFNLALIVINLFTIFINIKIQANLEKAQLALMKDQNEFEQLQKKHLKGLNIETTLESEYTYLDPGDTIFVEKELMFTYISFEGDGNLPTLTTSHGCKLSVNTYGTSRAYWFSLEVNKSSTGLESVELIEKTGNTKKYFVTLGHRKNSINEFKLPIYRFAIRY